MPWQLVAIDRGDPVPDDPRAFAGIGMMGGPMSANDPLPWIAPLSALLRDAVDAARAGDRPLPRRPAARAGARRAASQRAPVPEIGWIDVDDVDVDARDEWFGGRERFTPFQWHYDAFDDPARRDARARPTRSIATRRTWSTTGTSASSAMSR